MKIDNSNKAFTYQYIWIQSKWKITEDNFLNSAMPKIKELKKTDKLNYMFVLDTSLKNFIVVLGFKMQ